MLRESTRARVRAKSIGTTAHLSAAVMSIAPYVAVGSSATPSAQSCNTVPFVFVVDGGFSRGSGGSGGLGGAATAMATAGVIAVVHLASVSSLTSTSACGTPPSSNPSASWPTFSAFADVSDDVNLGVVPPGRRRPRSARIAGTILPAASSQQLP
jgi:hypothetical protein